MKKLILTLILALSLVSGAAVAGDNLPTDQSNTNSFDIKQNEIRNKTLLDSVTGLLSFSGVQSSYEPGESAEVEVEAQVTQTFDTEGAEKIVNIYKCADSSCDTPPPISSSSEDQCSSEEWYLDYDDCIAHHSDTVPFSYTQQEGTTWTWDVDFDAPNDEATYMLVGYIHKNGFVTDVSEEKFRVEASEPEPEPEPNVREVDGNIPVTVENGQITATPEFSNVGDGDMQDSDIVEMQVRPENTGLLSFFGQTGKQLSYVSSGTGTCDSDTPENVHKEFRLDSRDSREISLSTSTDNVEGGERYDVWIVTREECGGARADPYGGGVIADTVFVEAANPDGDEVKGDDDLCPKTAGSKADGCPVEPRIEQASQDIQIEVTDSTVTSKITLLNTADEAEGIDGVLNPDEGDMKEPNIIEMQVRPQNTGLLSTATSTGVQDVCDPEYPENVHKPLQIAAGETLDVTLTTELSELESGQVYDVWIVTRQECGGGPSDPYGTGVKAGNFEYQETGTTSEICGNGVDDDVDGKVDEDCGNGLPVVPIAAGILLVLAGGAYYLYDES